MTGRNLEERFFSLFFGEEYARIYIIVIYEYNARRSLSLLRFLKKDVAIILFVVNTP